MYNISIYVCLMIYIIMLSAIQANSCKPVFFKKSKRKQKKRFEKVKTKKQKKAPEKKAKKKQKKSDWKKKAKQGDLKK